MNIFNRYTMKTLKKNRMRTIVTICGIILSVSMITAVTTLISSFQTYLVDTTIDNVGEWHGVIYDMQQKDVASLEKEEGVRYLCEASELGYAKLLDSKNEAKPYLYIQTVNDDYLNHMSVHLEEGRYPKNSHEIVLPASLADNGRVMYKVGDQLDLQVGERTAKGGRLNQEVAYGEEGEETLSTLTKKTYTVVKIVERLGVESYDAPGYTALTIGDVQGKFTNVYTAMETPKMAYQLNKNYEQYKTDVNTDLLRFLNESSDKMFNQMLYGLATILIVIIVFASISLIYNAFSISVSERTKQFGLMSSLGATRRQLRKSVLFEAGALSVVAIPLGLAAGIAGIGITLNVVQGLFEKMVGTNASSRVSFHVNVSWESLVIAILLSIVTVMLSAYIPCHKALKKSAIEAIRQTNDIKINPRKVKTGKWVYRIFGFEGMIASKNFKRNKSKYRATVSSLFVSIVLFISANSFSTYLRNSATGVMEKYSFDLMYTTNKDMAQLDTISEQFKKVAGVNQIGYTQNYWFDYKPEEGQLTDDAKKMNEGTINIYVEFVDSSTFEQILSLNHLSKQTKLVGIDYYKYFDTEEKRYSSYSYFQNRENVKLGKLEVDQFVDQLPMGIDSMYGTTATVFCSIEDKKEILSQVKLEDEKTGIVFMKVNNHKETTKELNKIIDRNQWDNGLEDIVEAVEVNNAIILILDIFTYGFITLISLIAIANVFNTISTNILLRKREFAVLRSIGLTKRSFHRMMNFECILYGVKSLLYGIPVSLLLTYFMYRTIMQGIELPYLVPWLAIIVSVIGVFAIVFTTMLFATHKVNQENTIDALKNENA